MVPIAMHPPLTFVFGLLGNIVSFMVYLAPLPTFCRVYKKKSTEGFHSIPYVVALFCAMLWLYYGLIKSSGIMLITINAIGSAIETIYIVMYLIYAPRSAKMLTLKLLILLNVGMYGSILCCTLLFASGARRAIIVGWICAAFSVSVFAAPMTIIRLVIRTRSVEFMPFSLSFFLTLTAIMWFSYGLLSKDYFIALPNVLGFAFGIAQMILYLVYKNKKAIILEQQLAEEIKVSEMVNSDATPVDQRQDHAEKPINPSDNNV